MLNPHFIMNCLNVDSQINLEMMNNLVQSGAVYRSQGFEDNVLGCSTILLGQ